MDESKGRLKRVVATLLNPGKKEIFAILQQLRTDDEERTIVNCVETLNKFRSSSANAKKLTSIAREMKKLFRGRSLHAFAMRVITENIFGPGRMRSAASLDYTLVSPFIIVDNLLSPKREGQALTTMVRAFRGNGAMEVVSFVAQNYRDKNAIMRKLRRQDCFDRYVVDDFDTKWTAPRLKDFIKQVCRILEKPVPAEARPILVAVDIGPHLNAFLRGEAEEYDFFLLCDSLVFGDDSLFPVIIDVVAPRAPHLANYIAERKGLPPVPIPADAVKIVPACSVPFNVALHDLPLDKVLVVRNGGDVNDFKGHLERSRYFSAEFHGAATEGGFEAVGLITFCLRSKIFYVAPRIYPHIVAPIIEILKTTPRTVFIYRWFSVKKEVSAQFGWVPEDIIEVQDVAKEIGIPTTVDAITEKTVGGAFCRRASSFADASLPSEVARQHSAIRATLFYEFVARFRRLREERRQRQPQQQPQSRDGGENSHRRSIRDQEIFSPDERHHRHHRSGDRDQSRPRDRNSRR